METWAITIGSAVIYYAVLCLPTAVLTVGLGEALGRWLCRRNAVPVSALWRIRWGALARGQIYLALSFAQWVATSTTFSVVLQRYAPRAIFVLGVAHIALWVVRTLGGLRRPVS